MKTIDIREIEDYNELSDIILEIDDEIIDSTGRKGIVQNGIYASSCVGCMFSNDSCFSGSYDEESLYKYPEAWYLDCKELIIKEVD